MAMEAGGVASESGTLIREGEASLAAFVVFGSVSEPP